VDADAAMKVGILTASISRNAGGLFWAVRSLSASLMDAGCEVRVFGGDDDCSDEDRLTWGRVPLEVQATIGPRAFGFQRGLQHRLAVFQPDLAHVHGLWMYPSMAAVHWSGGRKPYVISPHGMLDPWAVKNSGWKKKIAALVYENAHLQGAACIHALCESERQAIRAFGLKNPVAVIPNGVDLHDLNLDLPLPDWNVRLPTGAKVLFFLSRLHPKKGLSILLDAWARARLHGLPGAEEWQLVIAGWEQGGHQADLENQARELAVADSVHFVGPQFDLAKAASFQRADAFVLPSFSEGLPMAVLEAWSYARPVLMTSQCNLPEGFAAGAAMCIEPQVESVACGLGALFRMPDHERIAMGQRGRDLVARQFTWSRIGAEMANVYCWVLGQGLQPDCVRTD
jgi:glycosyltransferase involved in cell wall biosynthesis